MTGLLQRVAACSLAAARPRLLVGAALKAAMCLFVGGLAAPHSVPAQETAPLVADAAKSSPAEPPQDRASNEKLSILPQDYSCTICHRKGGELWTDVTPVADETKLLNDIHWLKGLRCHDCHGGSPTFDSFKNHRNDPTFYSLKPRDKIPEFCGRCHSNFDYMRTFNPSARTDQESEYWRSGHGMRLKASAEGENPQIDKAVATCVDCHGHHGIRAVKDVDSPVYRTAVGQTCARCHSDEKLMAGRMYHDKPLATDQFEQWRESVHGQAMLKKGDLSAPTCNNCHGNHGALPPGVGSVANACGICHGKIANLFANTQMRHKFEAIGLPGCATCHGMHAIKHPTDDMLGLTESATCAKCHNEQNPQYGATVAGTAGVLRIRARFDQLKQDINEVEAKIHEAERLGMEVRGPHFDLRQAFDSLTNARTLVHSFNPAPIDEALNEGLKVTAAVRKSADATIQEHTNRRIWLGASLIPIFVVVGLLVVFIRKLGVSEPG